MRPVISFEKMADEKDAVDDGGKSFSFKFSKSKKNKTVVADKKINTFDDKVEETEDVDYVLATEGKEFKRYGLPHLNFLIYLLRLIQI